MEVGGTEEYAGVYHAAQGRAVLLLLKSAHLQAKMRHWAVNCDRNLRLRGLGGEDNNVLMEGDRASANNACARTSCEGRRGTACTARSNLVKGRMVLSSKDLATLLKNILPVHRIKITAFLLFLAFFFFRA
jgi:hypothetical protein